jgi:hypothetical protein
MPRKLQGKLLIFINKIKACNRISIVFVFDRVRIFPVTGIFQTQCVLIRGRAFQRRGSREEQF